LTVRWKQLWQDGRPADYLEVARCHLKGGRSVRRRKVSSRRVPLNESAVTAILEHKLAAYGSGPPDGEEWVFRSKKRYPGVLGRKQAYRIIAQAALAAGLGRRISPHSLRRSFAGDAYLATGKDLLLVQRLLGHSSCVTTSLYLRPEQDELDDVVRRLPFLTAPAPVGSDAAVPHRISTA
jgi:site-specific recombinase XerD